MHDRAGEVSAELPAELVGRGDLQGNKIGPRTGT